MKRNKLGTVVAVFSLILALWAPSVMAYNYTVTGYTGSMLYQDAFLNPLNGDAGQVGYYSINLTGANPWSNNITGLTGSFTLFDANPDGSRNTVNPTSLLSTILADIFYLNYANGVITLGSTVAGVNTDMLQLGIGAPPADPYFPSVTAAPAKNLGNGNVYVNQVYVDPVTGAPFSYDELGLPTNPVTAYGSILVDAFLATDVNGNIVDMVIEDASAPAPVPEPSTFALLGIALFGFVIWQRRKSEA